MTEATPISLRLNEGAIEVLKKEARKQSYEADKDVSYVDLIRKAVDGFVAMIEPQQQNSTISIAVALDGLANASSEVVSDAITDKSEFDNLSGPEWLKYFGIDLENPVAKAISNHVNATVDKQSLARVVLDPHRYKFSDVIRFNREQFNIAYFIERRGAVPTQCCEGEYLFPPTFEIACYPTAHIKEILGSGKNTISKIGKGAADAMLKEEEGNLWALLSEAGNDNQIQAFGLINLDHIQCAYNKLIQNGYHPTNIIMHPLLHSQLASRTTNKPGYCQFNMNQDNRMNGGYFLNATFRLSDRFNVDEVYVLAEPERVGYFAERQSYAAVVSSEPTRLRSGVIVWEEIGMVAFNTPVAKVVLAKQGEVTQSPCKKKAVLVPRKKRPVKVANV